ncbi:hypothetical protein CY35_08G075000 [Sphagnum magellanicum]|nr:hypothetical protein CY35_08G075000 [Sphagnum magellanicum]
MNSGENHVNIGRGICRVVMKEDGVEEISQSEKSDRFEAAAIVIQRRYREYQAHKHGSAASSANNFGWSYVEDAATRLQDNLEQSYSHGKTDTVAERWHRVVMKAAMVGRGLSKDAKALKLGLQHWLEAVDPKHRYGHNLCFYFEVWLKSPTQEPFYYWLDIGEGKDVELESCSRSKLEKGLVTYLDLNQREKYEVIIEDGKLFYKLSGKLVHTPKDDKWIFVMSPSEKLYVAKKKKGKLQHSSFLAGGVTIAAGRLIVNNGILELIEAHSGHYLPKPENFQTLIAALTSSGADLTVAKVELESEEEVNKRRGAVGSTANAIVNHEKAFEVLLESAGFSLNNDKKPNIVNPDSTDNEEGSDEEEPKTQQRGFTRWNTIQ